AWRFIFSRPHRDPATLAERPGPRAVLPGQRCAAPNRPQAMRAARWALRLAPACPADRSARSMVLNKQGTYRPHRWGYRRSNAVGVRADTVCAILGITLLEPSALTGSAGGPAGRA